MLPHYKVYTRLGISQIHGIGVFAIADIEKDTSLFEFDNTEMVWISGKQLLNITSNIKKMYDDFCVIKKDENLYGCPTNFNQLTMAWYMNNSDNPNVEVNEEYNFKSKRFIKEGEELTIDYKNFSD